MAEVRLLPYVLAWLGGMAGASALASRFLSSGELHPALVPLALGGLGLAGLATAFIILSLYRRDRSHEHLVSFVLLLLTLLAAGTRYWGWRAVLEKEVAAWTSTPPHPICMWGTVIADPVFKGSRLETTVRLEAAADLPSATTSPLRTPVLLRVLSWEDEDRKRPQVGDRLRIWAQLEWPEPGRNPGEFDYRSWLRSQGIAAVAVARSPAEMAVLGRGYLSPLQRLATCLRHAFSSAVRSHLPATQAALVEGMVLGIRTGLPDDLREAFNLSGLVHLLAVSGSNVGLVAGATLAATRWLGFRIAQAMALAVVWVFAATASGGPSVWRAAVMASIVLGARLWGRPAQPVNSLAVAVIVLTVVHPASWEDAGFWLSVGATAGILAMGQQLSSRAVHALHLRGFPAESIVETASVSLATQLAVFPVSLLYFQRISPLAPFSNVAALPLVGVITMGGLVSAAAAHLHSGLGHLLFQLLGVLVRILESIARSFAGLPGAAITLPAPRWPYLIGYYLFLAWACGWLPSTLLPVRGPWTRPRLLLAVLLILIQLLTGAATVPPRHVLQAVFFDVGQGDAMLFSLPGGPCVLVDAGPAGPTYDAGADTILPYLRRLGIRRLNLMVITHGHADHAGGAAALLSGVKVDELWLGPGTETEYATLGNCLGNVHRVVEARAGLSRQLTPRWHVEVLHPSPGPSPRGASREPPTQGHSPRESYVPLPDENDSSVVLRLVFGRRVFMLAADIERAGEEALVRHVTTHETPGVQGMPVDVLKVPHHGSPGGTGPSLLRMFPPRHAVIQVGRNAFGHPHPATLARLEEAGARVWRTDWQGAVLVTTDGHTLHIRAHVTGARPPAAYHRGSAGDDLPTGRPGGPHRSSATGALAWGKPSVVSFSVGGS